MNQIPEGPFACYLAPRGQESKLERELGGADAALGRLFIKRGAPRICHWAQNIWQDPRPLAYASISDAARQLRAIQRNWAPYSFRLHRRTALLAQALPPLSRRPRSFPFDVPAAPMGSFTLIDEGLLLASPACSSPFPNGEINLEENKTDPPSRAYLKLQEALILLGRRPAPGQRCVDAGASPGGWTWTLRRMGALVTAIDRSELAPSLMADPGVTFVRHSAFTLRPQELGPADWVFSDVICYPPRLLEWIRAWLESGLCRNYVCSLKMQGEPDWEAIRAFASIPGSRVLHLSANKNELTWMLASN
jgi:23S rRNA (cytidine2498-2'-O)-methyltransferase